jgi:hypothetical protein
VNAKVAKHVSIKLKDAIRCHALAVRKCATFAEKISQRLVMLIFVKKHIVLMHRAINACYSQMESKMTNRQWQRPACPHCVRLQPQAKETARQAR